VLSQGYKSGWFTADDLKEHINEIWTRLDPPTSPRGPLTVDDWVELFRGMGFYMQAPRVDLGSEPYVIYRAAPAERAKGMSWCNCIGMAKNFLPKHKQFGDYKLWQASVASAAVLAVPYRQTDSYIGLGSAGAREVVVDPAQLGEVREVTLAAQRDGH